MRQLFKINVKTEVQEPQGASQAGQGFVVEDGELVVGEDQSCQCSLIEEVIRDVTYAVTPQV